MEPAAIMILQCIAVEISLFLSGCPITWRVCSGTKMDLPFVGVQHGITRAVEVGKIARPWRGARDSMLSPPLSLLLIQVQ